MIARIGATELTAITNYLGVVQKKTNAFNYVRGKQLAWWWDEKIFNQMNMWSGFFPSNSKTISMFSELMIEDLAQVDILGSWQEREKNFSDQLAYAKNIELGLLEPYFSLKPWTHVLKEKKFLVIHPFKSSIEAQYKKRKLLFDDEDFLPKFELKVIKSVQSIAGEETQFKDWFQALDYMKQQIDN